MEREGTLLSLRDLGKWVYASETGVSWRCRLAMQEFLPGKPVMGHPETKTLSKKDHPDTGGNPRESDIWMPRRESSVREGCITSWGGGEGQ